MNDRSLHERWQELGDDANLNAVADWRNYRGPGYEFLLKPEPTIRFGPAPRDILVQCPKCKTVETLQFAGQTMLCTRKFYQRDGHVYHDCGSEQPCRLRR